MTENEKIKNYIQKYKLEEYLNYNDIENIKIKTLEKDSYLMMTGMEKNKLYLFVDGMVKVTLMSDEGNEILMSILKPFNIFGDVECILKKSIYYNIFIQRKSIFLEIDFEAAVKNTKIYKLISESLAQKLRQTSKRYSRAKLFDTRVIVLDFIQENEEYFSENFKYTEFSKIVGISERQLRRILKELEQENLIKKEGKKIKLMNNKIG